MRPIIKLLYQPYGDGSIDDQSIPFSITSRYLYIVRHIRYYDIQLTMRYMMALINIKKVMMDTCIALKQTYQSIDCIIFKSDTINFSQISDIYCWPSETVFPIDDTYLYYNSRISDSEWSAIYDETTELLPYITIEYGVLFCILVDVTKEEIRVMIGPHEWPIVKFTDV